MTWMKCVRYTDILKNKKSTFLYYNLLKTYTVYSNSQYVINNSAWMSAQSLVIFLRTEDSWSLHFFKVITLRSYFASVLICTGWVVPVLSFHLVFSLVVYVFGPNQFVGLAICRMLFHLELDVWIYQISFQFINIMLWCLRHT